MTENYKLHRTLVCDCPEPCACYSEGYVQGKGKSYFEMNNLMNRQAVGKSGSHRWRLVVTGVGRDGVDAVRTAIISWSNQEWLRLVKAPCPRCGRKGW